MRKLGKIGVYGKKTRSMQRRLSFEAFGLTFKMANIYLYLGDRNNADPSISDISTKTFWEVPDRAYNDVTIPIPIGMEPFQESQTDFSRFGIINPMQDETTFRVHMDDMTPLGRDIVVGDVFELPFYSDSESTSFWEITDVDKRAEKEKYLFVLTATPLGENRKTREIPVDNGAEEMFGNIMDEAEAERKEEVPQEGTTFEEDPTEEEVDYRDDLQSSFLDDPNKQF